MNDQSRSPRFVAFARCSGAGFHGTVAEQLAQIRKFAARSTTRLNIVDTIEVNGSAGEARQVLCQLVERKAQENDFDGIICTSRDRLTRHTAQYQLLELEMADIRVISVAEHSSDDNDLLGFCVELRITEAQQSKAKRSARYIARISRKAVLLIPPPYRMRWIVFILVRAVSGFTSSVAARMARSFNYIQSHAP